MLYLPKNDRIVFTFFVISLTVKRLSRATKFRAVVSIKNKLISLLGDNNQLHKRKLVPDIKDENYPNNEAYHDFEVYRRWKAFNATKQQHIPSSY